MKIGIILWETLVSEKKQRVPCKIHGCFPLKGGGGNTPSYHHPNHPFNHPFIDKVFHCKVVSIIYFGVPWNSPDPQEAAPRTPRCAACRKRRSAWDIAARHGGQSALRPGWKDMDFQYLDHFRGFCPSKLVVKYSHIHGDGQRCRRSIWWAKS